MTYILNPIDFFYLQQARQILSGIDVSGLVQARQILSGIDMSGLAQARQILSGIDMSGLAQARQILSGIDMTGLVQAIDLSNQIHMAGLAQAIDFSSQIDMAGLAQAADFSTQIDMAGFSQALDISSQIVNIVRPISEWQEEYSDQINWLSKDLNSSIQLLTANFAALDLSFLALGSGNIFSDLISFIREEEEEEKEEKEEKTAEAFKAASWPIAPSMSPKIQQRVIDLHEQGKTRYISNVIIGYYRKGNYKNLKNMVESWHTNPLFSSWMPIMKDALDAYCDGKHTLLVPALLPTIEGILSEYAKVNNLSVKYGREIRRLYETVIGSPDDYGLTNWAIVRALLYHLENSTYVYSKFSEELKKSANRRSISRHTVLHGISTNYNRPSQSLKIFALLDAICALCLEKGSA